MNRPAKSVLIKRSKYLQKKHEFNKQQELLAQDEIDDIFAVVEYSPTTKYKILGLYETEEDAEEKSVEFTNIALKEALTDPARNYTFACYYPVARTRKFKKNTSYYATMLDKKIYLHDVNEVDKINKTHLAIGLVNL